MAPPFPAWFTWQAHVYDSPKDVEVLADTPWARYPHPFHPMFATPKIFPPPMYSFLGVMQTGWLLLAPRSRRPMACEGWSPPFCRPRFSWFALCPVRTICVRSASFRAPDTFSYLCLRRSLAFHCTKRSASRALKRAGSEKA